MEIMPVIMKRDIDTLDLEAQQFQHLAWRLWTQILLVLLWHERLEWFLNTW